MSNQQQLLKQLENLRQNLQKKQNEQTEKFYQMMQLLDSIMNEIKLNGQYQFDQLQDQINKYLGLADGSKYKIFHFQEDILKKQPQELVINQENLFCQNCPNNNNILYFYLKAPFVSCRNCCQNYQNGMKFEEFQNVYYEARKNYIKFENIKVILEKLYKLQIEETQFFNQMKMYYISLLRGKQKYCEDSKTFKELIKDNVEIRNNTVKDLCCEINLQKQHLFQLDMKILNQLDDDIRQTFNAVYDLRMKYKYPEIQNSQLNQAIIYKDEKLRTYWVDVDKPSKTFNEFIDKLRLPVNIDRITSEQNEPVRKDYDLKIYQNGQMQIFNLYFTYKNEKK